MTVIACTRGSNVHTCRAYGCTRRVPKSMLMCGTHWRMVPKETQSAVLSGWRLWNGGGGSAEWAKASDEAIHLVAIKERHPRHGVCRVCRGEQKRQGELFS